MPQPPSDSNIRISDSFFEAVLFFSGTVGFFSYPLSSSFMAVFGDFDSNFPLYYHLPIILFLAKGVLRKFVHVNRLCDTANFGFLVVILTSVYTVFEDKGSSTTQEEDLLGDVMTLMSSGAFALMSMSMSGLMHLRYEVGASSFFLGCLMVQWIKINNVVAMFGGGVCWCSLVVLRYFLPSTRLYPSMVSFVNRFFDVNRDDIRQFRHMVAFLYLMFGPSFIEYPGGDAVQVLAYILHAVIGARYVHTGGII